MLATTSLIVSPYVTNDETYGLGIHAGQHEVYAEPCTNGRRLLVAWSTRLSLPEFVSHVRELNPDPGNALSVLVFGLAYTETDLVYALDKAISIGDTNNGVLRVQLPHSAYYWERGDLMNRPQEVGIITTFFDAAELLRLMEATAELALVDQADEVVSSIWPIARRFPHGAIL